MKSKWCDYHWFEQKGIHTPEGVGCRKGLRFGCLKCRGKGKAKCGQFLISELPEGILASG